MNRWVTVTLRLIVVSTLIFGLFIYGEAHNQGQIPEWGTKLFSIGWPMGMIVMALIYFVIIERRVFGRRVQDGFSLLPHENRIFAGNFISVEFYPNAGRIPKNPGFLDWTDPGNVSHRTMMKVWVTNSRLLIGTPWGHVRRAFPISSIQSFASVPGPHPFNQTFILRFTYMDKPEAFRIWIGRRSRGLIQILQEVSGGASNSRLLRQYGGSREKDIWFLLMFIVVGAIFVGMMTLRHKTGYLALVPICIIGGIWLWQEIRRREK